jgi:hypothetical protein
VTDAVPMWAELPTPRPPTPAEAALLVALVGRVPAPGLAAQVASVRVTATCRCGCSSVRLQSDAPAVPPAVVAGLSPRGRSDHLGIQAHADGGDQPVQVVVHVIHGRLAELEIHVREGLAVRPPAPEALGFVDVV